ncbi:MAG: TIGR03435 family protein [Candidatus Acidiferrales bacterium]
MKTVAIIAAAFMLMPSALHGQSTPSTPSFDVASLKLHPDPPREIDISTSGSRLTAKAETVLRMIAYAYDLKGNYQVARNPALLAFGDKMYDIEAEVDASRTPTKSEFRQMLQSLLADRFHLKVHREQRDMKVYALVLEKNGPKFKQSDANEKFSGLNGVDGRNQTVTLTNATMNVIVEEIHIFTDRPVIDKTGLSGNYDIKFEATPAFRFDTNPDPHDISILTALPEQTGLKMESEKHMVDVIVVDHVEPPSPN